MGLMLEALKRIDRRPLSPGLASGPTPAAAEPPAPCAPAAPEIAPSPAIASDVPDLCETALASALAGIEELQPLADGAFDRLAASWADPLEGLPPAPAEPAPPEAGGLSPVAVREPSPPDAPKYAGQDPYAKLAARILDQLIPGYPAAFHFASAGDDDDAATVLAQLVPALAEQSQVGVLLVDADFWHPSLAWQLGVDAAGGLADVLAAKKTWSDAVCPTGFLRLHLLPGGPVGAAGTGCRAGRHGPAGASVARSLWAGADRRRLAGLARGSGPGRRLQRDLSGGTAWAGEPCGPGGGPAPAAVRWAAAGLRRRRVSRRRLARISHHPY